MLNNITLAGRLTRDPELRRTNSGTAVASLTLAVERDFADKETGERLCDFIDCVAWRGTAEFIERNFRKGQMAIVNGRLEIRKYTDKDGNARRVAEVKVDNIYFGGAKQEAPADAPAAQDFAQITEDDETLPF